MMRRQQGSALVIALVIVAIATVLATALMWRTHLDQRRVEVQLYGQQAMQYLLGAESWTKTLLLEDSANVDHLQEPWAQQAIVLPVDGGFIEGRLSDLQGRFNINNLAVEDDAQREAWLANFERLLDLLGLDPVIAPATLDWLDGGFEPTGFEGAEDDFYLGQAPAYRTANQEMHSISELRLVKGMTPEQFARLEPYITALPTGGEPTKINVNTAPAEVLAALGERVTPGDAATIVQLREQAPFNSLDELDGPVGNDIFDDQHVDVSTEHFLLQATSGVGSVEITLYSVLRRQAVGQGGGPGEGQSGQNTQASGIETLRRARGTL